MPESKATIIITAKDQAGATLNKVFMEVNAQLGKTAQAQGNLSKETEKSTSKTKDQSMNFVDMAAKLYLVQVAIRNVAEALQSAFEFGKLGAQVEQTQISFANMTKSVGANVDLLQQLKTAAHGTVSDLQLMQAAQTALIGLNKENGKAMADSIPRILEIARAANIANPALGDTAFLFESLTTGLKRMSPRLIDNTGLQLKLGDANKKYAEELGKTVEQLTAEEKQIALLNATLEAGDRLIEQIGGSTQSAVDPFDRLTASGENLKNAIAADLSPALGELLTTLAFTADGLTKLFIREEQVSEATVSVTDEFVKGFLGLKTFDFIAKGVTETMRLQAEETKSVETATQDLTDSRREAIESSRDVVEATEEEIKAQDKFIERRTSSLNSLFIKELQIQERRVDAERRTTQKIEDANYDLSQRLTDIHRDAEDERTRITTDAAEDRARIQSDYADRINDANKDIADLNAELENKNPFVSQTTLDNITQQETILGELEDRLRSLKRQQRDDPDNISRQQEIDSAVDLQDQLNETLAQLKDQAREEERRNRILARIEEKQDEVKALAEQRDIELAAVGEKEQAKLAIVTQTEQEKTAKVTEESQKRIAQLQAEFNQIRVDAERDIKIATVESFLALTDASSEVGKSLFEMQAKTYGATDAMISDFIKVRDSINGPSGIVQALNSIDSTNSFTRLISQSQVLQSQLAGVATMMSAVSQTPPPSFFAGGHVVYTARAGGGDTQAGHSYIVGENGPEVLTMGGDGYITPNNQLGGGGINVTLQAGMFMGTHAEAIRLMDMLGPLLSKWQTQYGGAPNAVGTRRIKSRA